MRKHKYHIRYNSPLYWLTVVGGFVWFALVWIGASIIEGRP